MGDTADVTVDQGRSPAVSVGREIVCRLRRARYGARTTETATLSLRVFTTATATLMP